VIQPDLRDPVEFTVYGTPVPQGSKRAFQNRVVDINAAAVRSWRRDVAAAAAEAMGGAAPLSEPLQVRIMFFLPRPKAHYGTGKNEGVLKRSAPVAPATKPDIDKLTRAVLDALTGVVFRDDAQVAGLSCSKLFADHPYTLGMMCSVLPLR
jgi:crossover junction endodeoxyribonuclease RusA